MIHDFGDKITAELFHGLQPKQVPAEIARRATMKLQLLDAATRLDALLVPVSNRLEKLEGDLREFYSIRVNEKYRIIFIWNNGNPTAVRFVDYH